ncbi:MAG: hypothetical protein M3179_03390 [Actinomycetota bacterium]|nr:hypothetical protein [Actinomycetota bacterium]
MAIEVRRLTKVFETGRRRHAQRVEAVKDLSLTVDRGERVLTSHDVADIEHVARRAIVINHGSVICDDDVVTMRRALLSTKLVDVGSLWTRS